ncbi:MAG TPA: capsule assembly Wzi family protein [Spongiibacteraceae bacterium]|nr:capsule assembly Wzi family protein [Spongiibacteraceae bacterium]
MHKETDRFSRHYRKLAARSRAFSAAGVLSVLLMAPPASAGPWAAPGDEELRHHLTVLADAKILTVPITTWPLPWAGIKQDLDKVDTTQLSDQVLWSLQYARFALDRQTRHGLRGSARVQLARSPQALRSFSDDRRERSEASASIDWMGDTFAVGLAGSAVEEPIDDKAFRPDGTYVAAVWGNWILSAGWQDRWWGPGWQSSLILSSSARPVPALALQRNFSDAFATPWLSWLGPWQFTTFAGRMDANAYIPHAKLLGARLTLKPFKSFELGVSRTAQWGGDGRPQSASSLWDLITGHDNAGSAGITKNNEPGNQLAGFDARWGFLAFSASNAIYAQITGEDESGGLPSRNMYLAGVETAFSAWDHSHRLVLEAADTKADHNNYAYEHGIYLDGYRYLGRPIGASFDNDSRALTLRGEHFSAAGQQLSWSVSRIELNRDGSNRALPGGNVFGAEAKNLTTASLSYGVPFADVWKITVGGEYYSRSLKLGTETADTGLFAKLELRL